MARPRGPNEPSTYQPQPTIPTEITNRVTAVKAVLAERMTITAAAESLGIARVNMQTLAHRAEAAIIETMTPRRSGPPPKSARERELEQQLKRLEKENAKLRLQLEAADDMMGAAGEIIRSLRGLPPRPSSRSSSPRSPHTSKPTTSSDDPEPVPTSTATLEATSAATTRALARIATIPDHGPRAARVLGIGLTTLRRWLGRLALGEPLRRRRGGSPAPTEPAADRAVRRQVRALAGMVGAASLARSVTGISRRAANRIKRDELAAIERERKQQCDHVEVTRPGVLRGFDAMHLQASFALVASDGHVPYRTSAREVPDYDAPSVAVALVEDFTLHGPPLVMRFDRASCHDAEPVASVLREFRVLALHGPPRHPQYYGQLERQNLEHRIWLDQHDLSDPWLDAMTTALNRLWRRPTLGWRTAEEVWIDRPPLDDDRDELRDEVRERAARRQREGLAPDLALRLAIEQALINRGYLRITTGRQMLCEQTIL